MSMYYHCCSIGNLKDTGCLKKYYMISIANNFFNFCHGIMKQVSIERAKFNFLFCTVNKLIKCPCMGLNAPSSAQHKLAGHNWTVCAIKC